MDLSAFTAINEGDGRRNQPYHPAMMLKVLIYGDATGVFSSRKLAEKLRRDVAFRMLAAENFPSYRTLSRFRQRRLKEFGDLFLRVLRLAHETGSVKFGNLAIDGTKLRTNASKRKAMNCEWMERKEERLSGEIAELLERAQKVDEEEKEDASCDVTSIDLSEELNFRERRLTAIQEAKREIYDLQGGSVLSVLHERLQIRTVEQPVERVRGEMKSCLSA